MRQSDQVERALAEDFVVFDLLTQAIALSAHTGEHGGKLVLPAVVNALSIHRCFVHEILVFIYCFLRFICLIGESDLLNVPNQLLDLAGITAVVDPVENERWVSVGLVFEVASLADRRVE